MPIQHEINQPTSCSLLSVSTSDDKRSVGQSHVVEPVAAMELPVRHHELYAACLPDDTTNTLSAGSPGLDNPSTTFGVRSWNVSDAAHGGWRGSVPPRFDSVKEVAAHSDW